MTAAAIARGLGLKKQGRDWRGPCPLHGGSSFTVSEKEGKPLFFCWSGCDRGEILRALKSAGLWPESNLTPVQKQDFAKQRARDAADLYDARLFADAAHILAEQALEGLGPCDPQRAVFTRLLADLRSDNGILSEFREWRATLPEITAALVNAGSEHRRRLASLINNHGLQIVRRVRNAA